MTGTLLLCICILIIKVSTEPQNKIAQRTFQNVDLGKVSPDLVAKLLSSKNLKNPNGQNFDLSSLKGGNGRFKQIIRHKFLPVNQTLNISDNAQIDEVGIVFSL